MNYNLLKTFIKVAEFGSFTKAAHQLKQPKSRVSRSITRLEEEMKILLIKRNTRSTSLTEAGKTLYQETFNLFQELEKKIEDISNNSQTISGTLSISAPIDFGINLLPKLISEFSKVHPSINFNIMLSDSYVDLNAHNIDLALRVGKLKDSSLKQKKLADTQLILVASENYLKLKGIPKKWQDLKSHEVLSFYNENQHDPLEQFYQKFGFSPYMKVNSFPMLRKLALESKGIAVLPNTICHEDVENKLLIQVFPQWATQKTPLQIVFGQHRNLSLKTRAFIDFLDKKNIFS